MSYFDIVHSDLLFSLLLKFDSHNLVQQMSSLHYTNEFKRVFKSQTFWKLLWRRDVSSFINPPTDDVNAYDKYMNIFHFDRYSLYCLGKHGYDILLYRKIRNMKDYNMAMAGAAEGGHFAIVERMLQLGATDYNWALREAATSGSMILVDRMLQLGASDYEDALYNASCHDHIEIVNKMLQLGAKNYRAVLIHAAKNGNTQLVNRMLKLIDPNDNTETYNEAICEASRCGYVDIVKLMLERGANKYIETMTYAICGGHGEIVELMLKLLHDTNYAEMVFSRYGQSIDLALGHNHFGIAQLLQSYQKKSRKRKVET